MGRRCVSAAVMVAVLLAFCSAGVARAAVAAEVVLGYGATYSTASGDRTHHGVDLAPGPEGVAECPAAGEVTFSGRIPADDGGSTLAITVLTADGVSVTLHPLSEAWVEKGACVSASEGIGLLAPSGDSSSPSQHLHLSARRGDLYIDPTFLLAVAEPPVSDSAVSADSPEPPVTEAPPDSGVAPFTVPATPATVPQSATPITATEGPLPEGVSLAEAGDVPEAQISSVAGAGHAADPMPSQTGGSAPEPAGMTVWRTGWSSGVDFSGTGSAAVLASMATLAAVGAFRRGVVAGAGVA